MHIRFRVEYTKQVELGVIYHWTDTFIYKVPYIGIKVSDLNKDELVKVVRETREIENDIRIVVYDIKEIDLTKPYCVSWEVNYQK